MTTMAADMTNMTKRTTKREIFCIIDKIEMYAEIGRKRAGEKKLAVIKRKGHVARMSASLLMINSNLWSR